MDRGVGAGLGGHPARRTASRQLATVLDGSLDLAPTETDHFADDDSSVHEDAIDRVAAAGIAQGVAEGQFGPEQRVTRGEVAAMVAEAFDVPAGDTAYFGDLGEVHATQIRAVANAGVAAGCADGRFCPTAEVRRGEMALLVARAMGLVDTADPITLEEHRANVAERREVIAAQEQETREAEQAAAEQERLRIWERLAQCESGGNWSINTGNGYYGGLQFSLSSWRGVGGSGYPHNASKAEQIRRGERLQDVQGWGAWPTCSRKIGLR